MSDNTEGRVRWIMPPAGATLSEQAKARGVDVPLLTAGELRAAGWLVAADIHDDWRPGPYEGSPTGMCWFDATGPVQRRVRWQPLEDGAKLCMDKLEAELAWSFDVRVRKEDQS